MNAKLIRPYRKYVFCLCWPWQYGGRVSHLSHVLQFHRSNAEEWFTSLTTLQKNSSSVTLFTVSSFVPSWTCALIVLLSNFFTSSSVQTGILDKTSVFIITTFRLIRIVNVMLEVVYRVPIVIDNGQEKSHKKLTFSINIATNQIYIAIIALLIEMGFLLLISYNYTMMKCVLLWLGIRPMQNFEQH